MGHAIYNTAHKTWLLFYVCLDERLTVDACDLFLQHDDVIKWKHFPRNWPFVRGIHRSRWFPHTKASDADLWCFFDLRLNKRLNKQSWGWWFETLSRPFWRHRNESCRFFHFNDFQNDIRKLACYRTTINTLVFGCINRYWLYLGFWMTLHRLLHLGK